MTFEARRKEHLKREQIDGKKKKKERENRRQYWIFRGYNTHEVFRAETILCYIVMGYVHSVASFVSDSFVTTWTIAHQAPLSMGFSRQEYWSGRTCPPPGDHPTHNSCVSCIAGGFLTAEPEWCTCVIIHLLNFIISYNIQCQE